MGSDGRWAMDPELAAAATMLEAINPDDLDGHRETLRRVHASQVDRWMSDMVVIEDITPGPAGSPPVALRTYRPLGAPPEAPTLLWLHGGAFAVGFAAVDDDFCVRVAAAAGYFVVSPEYRLAPEDPFPAGFSDCLAAYEWVVEYSTAVGADRGCLVVGGTSAGAGLAASLCLKLRDIGAHQPVLQLLACPVVDDRLATPSMVEYRSTPVFDRYQAELMWRRYLRSWKEEVPPYAAAGRARDLRGLPAAYVQTAEYDPLRDEGLDYARRLVDAGTAVELHLYPRTFHSFDMVVPTAAVSRRAFQEYLDVLRAVAARNAARV